MTPWRVLRYWRNMPFLLWANHVFKDGGRRWLFSIQAAGKTILLLGSLALDEQEEYPRQADLLILPYSGNNNLVEEADKIIERLASQADPSVPL